MNEDILRQAGLGHMVDRIKDGKCPTCKKEILLKNLEYAKFKGYKPKADGFRDDLSVKEFKISGMCQQCQDSVFDGEEE
jgi:hypothetical protein